VAQHLLFECNSAGIEMDLEIFRGSRRPTGNLAGLLECTDIDEVENDIRDFFRWVAGTGFGNHARPSEKPQRVAHSVLANPSH
jgi:hypothetical protein